MGSELKVAPGQLRAAAGTESAVGAAVSGLDVGQPLSAAAAAMPGLQSGAACGQVAPIVDGAAKTVGSEVSAHAGKLTSAADAYQRTDDESARRLNSIKPTG
ncbi:hypothetical protein A5733_21380 [Mycobacterium sp. NS-7484]|uniref:type VII secretion target n=1 Tax=unclassified Mycobacterium TaxID=2642494 RepID=UPI0008006515|nr:MULTISPECIES: type VII secretion target [unclassified Mycobacterium]OBG80659.1 hypothetical protein A5699_10485 [Mycobacterium sp. E802]OMC04419.1 hypothetical protein A5733_21380 [Mycobacterium sp. NS-7484]